MGIPDLSFLEGMVNLETLNLQNCRIKDISALTGSHKLSELALGWNEISDISVLRKLSNLRILYLQGNPVEDYSPLSSLDQLESLSFNDCCQPGWIHLLAELPKLRSLDGRDVTRELILEKIQRREKLD